MAIITGTAGNDSILPSGVSGGVAGGLPTAAAADTIIGTAGSDTIDGGDIGIERNTLDYRGFSTALTVTYTAYGVGSTVKAGGGTDTLTNINRIWGGSAGDALIGIANSGGFATHLRGGAGNDTIDGASNRANQADYFDSPAAISAHLASINATSGTVSDGWGGIDTLNNVRRISTSFFADTITGGGFGDMVVINGGAQGRTLDGGGSSDRGNELRFNGTANITIDLGTTAAAGGGYTGSFSASGATDVITRFTRVVGSGGWDTIFGSPRDDTIDGEAGNDRIIGRSGYDSVGYGDFQNSGAPVNGAVVDLTAGTATDGWGGRDSLLEVEAVFGGSRNDDLRGSSSLGFWTRSMLGGFGGADTLRGGTDGFSAADYNSAPGSVTVNLATGAANDSYGFTDTLININAARGGTSADTIIGGTRDEWLSGGSGNDSISGGDGADRLVGDGGNDTLIGGNGDDSLTGGDGVDSLSGGTGWDRFVIGLTTTSGQASPRSAPDVINDFSVADGDNLKFNTASDMTVRLLQYAGVVPGNWGALSADILLPNFTQPALYTAMPVWWVWQSGTSGWFVVDENRDGVLSVNETAVRIATGITDPSLVRLGGASVVTQAGDNAANVITVTAGVTGTALGLGGDDTLYGGGAPDNLIGGTGNDVYVVRHFQTGLRELAGEGYDVAWVDATDFNMGDNIEEGRLFNTGLRLNGGSTGEQLVANQAAASWLFGNDGNDVLWGSGLADTLDGGEGDDILRSQGGADTMIGGEGNDNFVVQNLDAMVTEHPNGGYDTAWVTLNNWTIPQNIEVIRLAAPDAMNLFGSSSSENLVANQARSSYLVGGGGEDVLWGSPFADTLDGGTGDDILRGQGANDFMIGGAGNDQFVIFASAATLLEGGVGGGYDIVYFAGSGSFALPDFIEEARLSGNATGFTFSGTATTSMLLVGNSSGLGSNIQGGRGADTIFGTVANDILEGAAGDDIIYTGGGADRLVFTFGGFGFDQVAVQGGSVQIQFLAASGITSMAQVSLNAAGGNTQVTTAQGSILVFGQTLTSGDFIFG